MVIRIAFSIIPNDDDPIIVGIDSRGRFQGLVDEDVKHSIDSANRRVEHLNTTYASAPALHVWQDLWKPQRRR